MAHDDLKELLEAYDLGERPFNQDSTAYDLQKEMEPLIDKMAGVVAGSLMVKLMTTFKGELAEFIDQFIEEYGDD